MNMQNSEYDVSKKQVVDMAAVRQLFFSCICRKLLEVFVQVASTIE